MDNEKNKWVSLPQPNTNSREHNRKLILSVIGIIVFASVYAFYTVGLFLRVGINSDYANLVLEASDILSGNPFLRGWNLTGITFITTDILYFIIGVLAAGTSVRAYYIAITLMFLMLFLATLLLMSTKYSKPKWMDLLILIAVAGVPCGYACDILRAHTAVAVYVFVAFFFAMKTLDIEPAENSGKKKLYYTIFTILLTLGSIGDKMTLIVGVLPVVAVCGYNLLRNDVQPHRKQTNFILLILAGISTILGFIIESLYLIVGNVNKNSFLTTKAFSTFEDIPKKFTIYLKSVFGMFNADLFGENLVSLSTVWYFLRVILILYVFFIMVKSIVYFIKHRTSDTVIVMLSIGFITMSALMIFTDIVADIYSARYIAYFPMLSAVVISRYFKLRNTLNYKVCNKRVRLKIPIAIMASLILVSSLTAVSYTREILPQDRLGAFLHENGLYSGYAKFWDASHTTLSSNGKVEIRAVIYDGGDHLAMFNWFCKTEWYKSGYANFVVIEKADNDTIFGITTDNVKKCYGNPYKILEVDKYVVYVYDYNIRDKIVVVTKLE